MNDTEQNKNNVAETVRDIMLQNRSRQIQHINGFPVIVDEHGEASVLSCLMPAPVLPVKDIRVKRIADLLAVIKQETKALGDTYEGRGYSSLEVDPRLWWVFDAEKAGAPGWGEMQVTLDPEQSSQYRAWRSRSETWQTQADLADFLEDYAQDVLGEDSSKLLTIAHNLEATVSSKIVSSQRPQVGDVTIHWETETNTGDIAIPQEFQIAIPLYQHTDPYKLDLSLKLRVREGQAKFLFKIKNLEQVKQAIFDEWRQSLLDAGFSFIIGTCAK